MLQSTSPTTDGKFLPETAYMRDILCHVLANIEHELTYTRWCHREGPWVQKAVFNKVEQEFGAWGSRVKKIIKLLDTDEASAWFVLARHQYRARF